MRTIPRGQVNRRPIQQPLQHLRSSIPPILILGKIIAVSNSHPFALRAITSGERMRADLAASVRDTNSVVRVPELGDCRALREGMEKKILAVVQIVDADGSTPIL